MKYLVYFIGADICDTYPSKVCETFEDAKAHANSNVFPLDGYAVVIDLIKCEEVYRAGD